MQRQDAALIDLISSALEAARREERERCAKIVRDFVEKDNAITAAILARPTPKAPSGAPKVNGFVDGDPARYGAACPRGCEQIGEHIHIPASARDGVAAPEGGETGPRKEKQDAE